MFNWIWRPFDQLATEQLYDAMMLRQRIFVIEQSCLYLDADGLDPRSWHGLGYSPSGTLLAYARIVPPQAPRREPSIGRVALAPELRGRCIGYVLMQRAMDETARLYPGQPIRVSAQSHLEGFYRRLGFEPSGTPYDDAGIAHIDMYYRDQASRGSLASPDWLAGEKSR